MNLKDFFSSSFVRKQKKKQNKIQKQRLKYWKVALPALLSFC